MHPFLRDVDKYKRIISDCENAIGLDQRKELETDGDVDDAKWSINQFYDLGDNSMCISAVFVPDNDDDTGFDNKVVVVFGFGPGFSCHDDATIVFSATVGYDCWEIDYKIKNEKSPYAKKAKEIADRLKLVRTENCVSASIEMAEGLAKIGRIGRFMIGRESAHRPLSPATTA